MSIKIQKKKATQKLKLVHIKIFDQDDTDQTGDTMLECLYVDGKIAECGDAYHDNIGDRIAAFCSCLEFMGFKTELEKRSINDDFDIWMNKDKLDS